MQTSSDAKPWISVCVPARNEEAYIGKCLDGIQKAQRVLGKPVEIICCLNRCTDRTEQVALAHGAIIVREDAKNLSIIRNAAVRASRADIIVTIDADSVMSENMLLEVDRLLSKKKYIGGGVIIKPERLSLGIAFSFVLIGLCLLPVLVSGGMFWCYRRDFEAIGGFDEKLLMGEDVDFAVRLKRYAKTQRKRFSTIYRAHIVTSCRKWDHFGDWFLLNPMRLWRFFKGTDRSEADRTWYEVKR